MMPRFSAGGQIAEDQRDLPRILGTDGRDGETGGIDSVRGPRPGNRRANAAPEN